jgi:hypothetical protein
MNVVTVIGIILIVLGAISLIYQGITYKTNERAVDLGPLKVDTEKEHHIPLPPILGTIALIGGIVMVISGGKHTRAV